MSDTDTLRLLRKQPRPKPAVKVLLNFSQIAIEALIRGGTLDIGAELRSENGKGNSEIQLRR